MGIAASVVSAILKSVVGDKFGSGLVKEIVDISIDGVSEKGINEITGFINDGRTKIDKILSRENMESMGVLEDNIDYVKTEIKDLLSKIDITDEVLRQCKYNNTILKDFMWNEYVIRKNRPSYIENESEFKACLFAVAEALNKVMRESEDFSKKMLMQISNTVDDTNVGLQNISDYLKENFGKLDDNSQIVLNLLLMILEKIQKMNMQGNETNSTTDEGKKFQNNKKQTYIENWNSRLFLHIDNDENPLTLKDAFIMPDYVVYQSINRIGFSKEDTLDKIIEKFVNYGKTSTMLITGVPGIGKSTIISWIANQYRDDDKVIIVRFRDWIREELEKGLLNAIYKTLECKKKDLEEKILVLDGFDEMKALDVRDHLLNSFFTTIKDCENFKCIITSRPAYINPSHFQNVIELKKFNIDKVDFFYRKIKGSSLTERDKTESKLDVLGIPVILYMAIMSGINISENPTKPELYNRIFAEKGGIFDKFYDGENEYSPGSQIMRNPNNIKKYLEFLREVAFKMYESNKQYLKKINYKVPELEFQDDKVSILEFPIKHLFENTEANIEFIHKSIYEYFVSEYFFELLYEIIYKKSKEIAGILGRIFKDYNLSLEILEYLKYKVRNSELIEKGDLIDNAFCLMMRDGMTFHTNKCYNNVIKCEKKIFSNMLKIMYIWDKNYSLQKYFILDYLNCNYNLETIILNNTNLDGVILKDVNLTKAQMCGAKICNSILSGVNLCEANLERAHLENTFLRKSIFTGANLRRAELRKIDLTGADLSNTDFREAILDGFSLYGANLENSIWHVDDMRKIYTQLYSTEFEAIIITSTYNQIAVSRNDCLSKKNVDDFMDWLHDKLGI